MALGYLEHIVRDASGGAERMTITTECGMVLHEPNAALYEAKPPYRSIGCDSCRMGRLSRDSMDELHASLRGDS